ncbi:hypothetical protein EW146_g6905 [Bondarzewia mesenterica]|uniref:Uncharacterized protein n=1 Tax=Bondarzewia mesenterica TaxID=1095465 RepID=A0A4S4LM92_9AGAM|nr:hypothetical protein EW146_g6905 [Bondarzewia mesenterica]
MPISIPPGGYPGYPGQAPPGPYTGQHNSSGRPVPYSYPGPPPAPPGVNPNHWASGRWQYHPPPAGYQMPVSTASAAAAAAAAASRNSASSSRPSGGPARAPAYGPYPPPSMIGYNIPPGWGIPPQYWQPRQNQGSEDYWKTELKENGLGLENMHIRQDPQQDQSSDGQAPHTPWTWVPSLPTQEDEDSTNASERRPSADTRNNTGQNQSQRMQPSASSQPHGSQPRSTLSPPGPYVPPSQPSQIQPSSTQSGQLSSSTHQASQIYSLPAPTPSRPSQTSTTQGESFTEVMELRPTFSPNIVRTPNYYANSRRSNADTPSRVPPLVYGESQSSSNRGLQRSHTMPNQSSTPTTSMTINTTTSSSSRAAPISRQQSMPVIPPDTPSMEGLANLAYFAEEAEGILSPLVRVAPISPPSPPRTNRHAHRSGSTPSSTISNRHMRQPSRSPTYPFPNGGFYETIPERSTPSSSSTTTSPRSSSRTRSTSSSTRTTSNPPSLQPSPHHHHHHHNHHHRQEHREHHEPLQIYASPSAHSRSQSQSRRESQASYSSTTPASAGQSQPQSQRQSYASTQATGGGSTDQSQPPSQRQAYASSQSYASPHVSSAGPSPAQAQSQRQSYVSAQSHTTNSSSTGISQAHSRQASGYNSYSGSSTNPLPKPPQSSNSSLPPPQMPTPPQGRWTRKMRWGFWNRRGDYLTTDMRVVYAPREHANPPDLTGYPTPTEGYRDHHGTFVRYEASRPELQESLPSRGEPPQLPYERFITYVYI